MLLRGPRLRYHHAAPCRCKPNSVTPLPRTGPTISAMQAMRLLVAGGATAAARAIVALSYLVSPARPASVDANGNNALQPHRTIDTVGAAAADSFEQRWLAAIDEIPPVPAPPHDPLDGLIGGLLTLPALDHAPRVTPASRLMTSPPE
jgi:hypothetical protein